jgi:chaperonin GroES
VLTDRGAECQFRHPLTVTSGPEFTRFTQRTTEFARMKVRPLHDRIIVQRLEEGEQRVGGIIIPDTAKEKPQQGKVVAAGKGKAKDDGKVLPLDVKAGDTILFGKYSGQDIKIDGEEYLIMREDEVLAVLEAQ